MDALIIREK